MWGDDGHVRLVDFGLAMQGKSKMKKVCGTSFFMAPEIINQQPYTKSCDVWSLGVVLYLMISGNLPFMATSIREI